MCTLLTFGILFRKIYENSYVSFSSYPFRNFYMDSFKYSSTFTLGIALIIPPAVIRGNIFSTLSGIPLIIWPRIPPEVLQKFLQHFMRNNFCSPSKQFLVIFQVKTPWLFQKFIWGSTPANTTEVFSRGSSSCRLPSNLIKFHRMLLGDFLLKYQADFLKISRILF